MALTKKQVARLQEALDLPHTINQIHFLEGGNVSKDQLTITQTGYYQHGLARRTRVYAEDGDVIQEWFVSLRT